MLIFVGAPNPPTDVKVKECTDSNSLVTWQAANDNNDVITEYRVYYNSSLSDDLSYNLGATVIQVAHISLNKTLANYSCLNSDCCDHLLLSTLCWSPSELFRLSALLQIFTYRPFY